MGHSATVLTEPAPNRVQGDLTASLIEVPMRGMRDLLQVLQAIEAAAPDFVQLEYSNYGWNRWGCAFWLNALFAALRWRGYHLRLALHEFPLHFWQHPLQAPVALLQRIHFWLLGLAAHDVVTNTAERVAILKRWFPWRKSAIRYRPNSNCNPVFPISEQECKKLREERGVRPADIVLAVYGLYGAGKNTEAAIEAALLLQGKLPVHLWLLGDASSAQPAYLAQLRNLSDRLGASAWWSGGMTPQEVSRHLQAVDIFLLPQPDGHLTRSGSFMAAAEHGLPVIAVHNPLNQREFQNRDQVWLVESCHPSEFAQAIAMLALDAGLRRRIGSQLRLLYQRNFSWLVTAKELDTTGDWRTAPSEMETAAPAKGRSHSS